MTTISSEVVAASVEEALFTADRWNEESPLRHHLGGKEFNLAGERREAE